MIGDFNVAFWLLVSGIAFCIGNIILFVIYSVNPYYRKKTSFRRILKKLCIELCLGLIFIVSGLLVKFICGVDIDIIFLKNQLPMFINSIIAIGVIGPLDFGITRSDSSSFEKENEYEKK